MLFQNPNFYSYPPQMAPYPPQMPPMMVQGAQMAQGSMQMQNAPQGQQMGAAGNSGMLYVGSRQEAQSYMMAPGCTVVLWDTNGPFVYMKQTDQAGKPTFHAFKLTPADEEPKSEYITRGEFEAWKASLQKEVAADE